MMNQITWQPGENGKGLTDQEHNVHVWNDEDYETHAQYLAEHPNLVPHAYFYVTPNGGIELTNPHPAFNPGDEVDRAHETIMDADPHFHVAPLDRWSF